MKWPRYLATFSCLLLSQEAAAAINASPVSIGIEEALRLAEQASENVTAAAASVDRAAAQERQAQSEWLPQINGSLGYDRLLEMEAGELPSSMIVSGTQQPTSLGFSPFLQENT